MTTIPGPYILGIDLGKMADYTALVIAEPHFDTIDVTRHDRAGKPEYVKSAPVYDLRHIERVPLRTRYTDAAAHVAGIVADLRQPVRVQTSTIPGFPVFEDRRPEMAVILDYTGVGIAVAEIFLAAGIDCPIVLVTITSGGRVTWDEVGIHVPKADLVSVVQRCLQEERLRMPADDPASDLLARELSDFQAVIGRTGHVSYGVVADWRDGQHDDLVLATALAAWWGESRPTPEIW
jgi:hypothetical protein